MKTDLSGFPARKEIETVENYVLSLQSPILGSLRTKAGLTGSQRLSVVLFVYEYRPARDRAYRAANLFGFC